MIRRIFTLNPHLIAKKKLISSGKKRTVQHLQRLITPSNNHFNHQQHQHNDADGGDSASNDDDYGHDDVIADVAGNGNE